MTNLQALTEKRAKAWEYAKAFLESKRGDDDIVSEEDTATYHKMVAEVDAFTDQIEILQKQEERERMMQSLSRDPILSNPTNGMGTATSPTASNAYSTAFWNALRTMKISNDLAEGTQTTGGYLVPIEFERLLVQALDENNIIRQLARVIPTHGMELQIPVVASRGNASWLAEGQEIPTSDDSFGQVILGAYKLGTMIKVSHELLADSAFPLDSFLAEDFGRRIGDLEEEAFISGNGTGKPTGFLTTATVGKTTSAATAISFDDVIDLYHSLKSPYRKKGVFIANDQTVSAMRKLKDSNGRYLWQPALTAGDPDTILGRPVYVSAYMPQIAAEAKALAFGDFSYYWIGDRQGRTFQRLDELFAGTDQVGFKATQRVDGKLVLPEAVKVLQTADDGESGG